MHARGARTISFVVAAILCSTVVAFEVPPDQKPPNTIAFASFAPLDTDIFITDAVGRNARAVAPHPDLDYNPSFSPDGRWIVFTSTRDGSADVYRIHADGTGVERLTDDPAFDDQAAVSPDVRPLAFVSSRSWPSRYLDSGPRTARLLGSARSGRRSDDDRDRRERNGATDEQVGLLAAVRH